MALSRLLSSLVGPVLRSDHPLAVDQIQDVVLGELLLVVGDLMLVDLHPLLPHPLQAIPIASSDGTQKLKFTQGLINQYCYGTQKNPILANI